MRPISRSIVDILVGRKYPFQTPSKPKDYSDLRMMSTSLQLTGNQEYDIFRTRIQNQHSSQWSPQNPVLSRDARLELHGFADLKDWGFRFQCSGLSFSFFCLTPDTRNPEIWCSRLDTLPCSSTPALFPHLQSTIRNPQSEIKNGAPGRTRTCDARIRNPVLYPPELRGHESCAIVGDG